MHQDNPSASSRQSLAAVALAWAAAANYLAEWALRLVNRRDLHGRYRPMHMRWTDSITNRVNPSYTAHYAITRNLLKFHFRGEDHDALMGLHVLPEDETCRWVVVDIDAHGDGADPDANFAMALAIYDVALAAGFDALLLDSNGKGGYHLWIIFYTPVPAADAWRLGKWLVRDFSRYGLAKPPETFPKSPRLTGKRIGNWVRLPGRHHTRDHWTRVWDPTRQCWADGHDAIALILAIEGKDVDIGSIVPADFDPDRRAAPSQRPRVTPARCRWQLRRDLVLARRALTFLGDDYRDDYDDWLRIGMALSELGDAGLALWHSWSEPSAKYEPWVLNGKWASFGSGAGGSADRSITLGTLFHMAKAEGWPGPPKRVRGVTRHRGSTTIRVSRHRKHKGLDS